MAPREGHRRAASSDSGRIPVVFRAHSRPIPGVFPTGSRRIRYKYRHGCSLAWRFWVKGIFYLHFGILFRPFFGVVHFLASSAALVKRVSIM